MLYPQRKRERERECACLRGGTGLMWRGRQPAAVLCQQLDAFSNNLDLTETKPEVAPEGTRLQGICPQARGTNFVESAYRSRPLCNTRSPGIGLGM